MDVQLNAVVWPSTEWTPIKWDCVVIYDDTRPSTALVQIGDGVLMGLETYRANRTRALRRRERTHRPFWPKRRQRMAGK